MSQIVYKIIALLMAYKDRKAYKLNETEITKQPLVEIATELLNNFALLI